MKLNRSVSYFTITNQVNFMISGDSIGQIQSAPENHYKVEVVPHNTPGGSHDKCINSEFIDVSDEGTALISERNPSVVYQVIKSEGSSRALQELTVAKIDGEISFIEVIGHIHVATSLYCFRLT